MRYVTPDDFAALVALVERKVLTVQEAGGQFMDLLGDAPEKIHSFFPLFPEEMQNHLRDLAALQDVEWFKRWFSGTGLGRLESAKIEDTEPHNAVIRKRFFNPERVKVFTVTADHPARVAIEALRKYLETVEPASDDC